MKPNRLTPGTHIRIRGERGRRALGTISNSPAPTGYLFYRSDYNLNEHLVALARVRLIRKLRGAR